jgi:hypothetical protein
MARKSIVKLTNRNQLLDFFGEVGTNIARRSLNFSHQFGHRQRQSDLQGPDWRENHSLPCRRGLRVSKRKNIPEQPIESSNPFPIHVLPRGPSQVDTTCSKIPRSFRPAASHRASLFADAIGRAERRHLCLPETRELTDYCQSLDLGKNSRGKASRGNRTRIQLIPIISMNGSYSFPSSLCTSSRVN